MAAVERRAHSVILLLTDGLGGDQMEVVRGAYAVVGAEIPLVGGCAGDDLQDEAHLPAVRRPGPAGLGRGRRRLVRRADRHRRPARLAARRRADAGHRQQRQPGPHPRRPAGPRRLPAPPRARRRPSTTTPTPSPASRSPIRWASAAAAARRCASSPGPTSTTARSRCIASVPQGGLAWIMEGDERLGPGGHRRRLRRSPRRPRSGRRRSGSSPSTASPGAACSAMRASGRRSSASPPSPAARPWPASTPTVRSPAPAACRGFHNQTLVVLALA